MKNTRRLLCGLFAVALGFSLAISASADTSIGDAKEKKGQLESQLGEVEQQVEALKEKSASTQEYLNQLDEQLAALSNQLVEVERKLEDKLTELQQTQAALEEAKAKKDRQYQDMKKRIKFMYESGDAAYLEMILKAKDFSDLLNKADYVKAISEYDRKMLTEFQNTITDIASKEAQVEREYEEIEALKASVEEQKATVESITSTKKQEMENYKQEIAQSKELAAEYEAEIEAQEELIQQLIAEAARKAEEERKKQQEAAAKAARLQQGTSAKLQQSDVPSVSASGWVWPCPASRRITSSFGYRIHPTLGYNKLHNGVDIGAPTGTQILAANAGTVIAAAYNASMGNYVMIDHGSGIVTIYMHCSALATSSGAKVSAGQTIAYVGTTGRSTGPHLHFGMTLNGSYVNPMNYVN